MPEFADYITTYVLRDINKRPFARVQPDELIDGLITLQIFGANGTTDHALSHDEAAVLAHALASYVAQFEE